MSRAFRYLLAAVVAVAVLLAALFGYVLGSVRPEQRRYVAAAQAVMLDHEAMIDQETGLRGYLLTHQSDLLAPYRSGVLLMEAQNAVLSRYAGSDPTLAPLLLDMRLAQERWASEWAAPAAALLPPPGVDLDTFVGTGKSLFDGYRQAEQRLQAAVSARENAAAGRLGAALGVCLGLILAVGTALAVTVARQHRGLRRAVIEPVGAIVTATERFASGDLDVRVDAAGPAELRRIADSLNTLGAALAEARRTTEERQEVITHQAAQLREILAMARQIAGSLSLRYVLSAVSASAARVSGFERVVVWLFDDDRGRLSAVHDSRIADGVPRRSAPAEVGVGVVGEAARYGRPATQTQGHEPTVEVHTERPLTSLAVPLVVGAQVSGVLEFAGDEPHLMAEGSLEVIEALAIHAAAAIEAARLHGEVEQMGLTDALTHLANRRSLDRDLALECERTARYGRPTAVVMFDVDNFKRFNDTFGHQRGDEVLQELAAVVSGHVRATDTVYRYGGEEFVVLARDTTAEEGGRLAERMRACVEQHFRGHGSIGAVTASFGVAAAPPAGPLPDHLLADADAALYGAKAAGRNRVAVGGELPEDELVD
ncbi:MAG TPA: diguanylate cyclase [Acidimicrobiales bacterium]|nr:diguanylate cyclase [Acidimicrobiales bacterium]